MASRRSGQVAPPVMVCLWVSQPARAWNFRITSFASIEGKRPSEDEVVKWVRILEERVSTQFLRPWRASPRVPSWRAGERRLVITVNGVILSGIR